MKVRRRRRAAADSRTTSTTAFNQTGLFSHHNAPTLLPIHPSVIRQWLRGGELDKLRQIVLEGQGHKLLGEYSPDLNVRKFLKTVPAYLARIDMLFESVTRGRLIDLQTLLNMDKEDDPAPYNSNKSTNNKIQNYPHSEENRVSRIRGGGDFGMKNILGGPPNRKRYKLKSNAYDLVLCRDETGCGLLHKAVIYNHPDIVDWLSKNYPLTLVVRDKEKRTPLHYCGLCEEPSEMWGILVSNGADPNAVDLKGHTPAYYMDHPDDIVMPASSSSSNNNNNSHFNNNNSIKYINNNVTTNRELVVKPANIRIWIHDRDLGRLQQVLWEGQGDRLRMETSHHPLIKRFLAAVPFIMGTIKEVHSSAINNDVILLKKYSQDPIPRDILRSKDLNGLTPLHKAAGLGHVEIVKEIISRCPEALNVQDKEGRTALHYAAALRDDGQMYRILKDGGAIQDILDKKNRPAGFYQVKPKELLDNEDLKILSQVPDAPRTASIHPPSWDWRLLQTEYDTGSSGYYTTVANHNQPSVNGDSAFEDMGLEEPSIDQSQQRFIDGERIRNPKLSQKMNSISNDEDIDEGVGAEPPDGTDGDGSHLVNRHGGDEGDIDSDDREYEEVIPTQQPNNPGDKRTDYLNEDDYINDKNKSKIIPNGNIKERTNNNNINEEINRKNGNGNNWRNISSRNQSPTRYSQAPTQQQQQQQQQPQQGATMNQRPRQPFDSPYRPRTVTLNDRKPDFTNADPEIESDVREIVNSGDLEGLAELVLSGQGDKLLSCRSRLPDVQMFIDNVPTYMAKIKAVHAYTREGNLRGVQTALDRRKFAVSRERGGLTPLHEATLYGRAAVLRYLAARFPETLHARDHHGRTALHYAATLPDNAHFYNVLLTLGADKDSPDKLGKTPEHYLKNPGELTHSQLLEEFEKGTQSEFGSSYSRSNNNNNNVDYYNSLNAMNNNNDNRYPMGNPGQHQSTQSEMINNAAIIQEGFPVFGAEDGQYLASSLGDPLIKGLTEVANVRPSQPIVYLANYLIDYNKSSNGETHITDIPNLIEQGDVNGSWRRGSVKEPITTALPKSRTSSAARLMSSKHTNQFDDNFNDLINDKNAETDNEADVDDLDDDDDDRDGIGEIKSIKVISDSDNENNFSDNQNNNDKFFVSPDRRNSQSQSVTSIEKYESAFKPVQRDDHGQSSFHFAASRTHGRNGLYQLLQDMDCNIALRDELYRTGRDVAMQINLPENVIAIDRYVVYLAANGFTDKLQELLLEGYDHVLDATDDQQNIVEITAKRGHQTTLGLLQSITTFEERRERLHNAIRSGNNTQVQEIIRYGNGPQLAVAKNHYSRCSLHIAVLCQFEPIVDHIATRYPQTLQVGDNLMRMPLHYAMGVDKVEVLSRILIKAGAQRIVKDLKGRQPSYYFMNKSEIQQLQDEEDSLRH